VTDKDRAAIEAGLSRLRLPESYWDAKLEQMWHLSEPVKCALCYFRPMDRGADHKAKHEHWARELATLEKMYTLPFTPKRRIER
jgi:hypothetical protein